MFAQNSNVTVTKISLISSVFPRIAGSLSRCDIYAVWSARSYVPRTRLPNHHLLYRWLQKRGDHAMVRRGRNRPSSFGICGINHW